MSLPGRSPTEEDVKRLVNFAEKNPNMTSQLFRWLLEAHLPSCQDFECLVCGILECPFQEPLHFHHEGCPSCFNEEL